ncbi:hypothetical protein GIW41_02410 [Pseudomonas sp. PA-6-1D]|uniref:hypothetical protein n=1 Tax=unclassified Pseudomonas TaxID=196821 RepID=UPI001F2F3305|nr:MULTISPECIES: hypothetical protein [unclassified Pseudomonas]MCF5143462.1 hypothetical protein [Pseudomonas sp. PA-6-3C]MCF5147969.1 hypothetical protein [Pseudomonas sp. PA-6-3F]MCF5160482.1 hypothetical protein [Pseudomonas sp. PA-6-2E]MCF5174101.1 hypothetical protein [Pseudomonas sp. PA-6-1D]MCF5193361.1 hypothetical protein [Pseudomonas sp. PA-6-1H]
MRQKLGNLHFVGQRFKNEAVRRLFFVEFSWAENRLALTTFLMDYFLMEIV